MKTVEAIEILARGVVVQAGRLLICRNRKTDNLYLPGGHVEWGESARAALEREIREEMGLKCRAGRFLGVAEHAFTFRGCRTCEINLVFEMTIPSLDGKAPPPSCEKKLEFYWMPLSRLKASRLNPRLLRLNLPSWISAPISDPSIERCLTVPALR